MRFNQLALAVPVVLLLACGGGQGVSDETTGDVAQAVTPGGLTASLTLPALSGGHFSNATLSVKNNSATAMSNWQVMVQTATGTSISYGSLNLGAETILMSPSSCTSCLVLFDSGTAAPLAAGATATLTFSGAATAASNYITIVNVDGDANGTTGSNWPKDGIDHIARSAASGAVGLLVSYETNKLPNSSPADPHYSLYDGFLLSAHMYTLNSTNTGIVFDPNAPGYAFIPDAAQATLAVMQTNPEVGNYLAMGLQSCFANANGSSIYTVKAAPFKGLTGAGTGTSWVSTPGGSAGSTDTYNVVVTPPSQSTPEADVYTLSLKSTVDTSFGAAYVTSNGTYFWLNTAMMKKFQTVTSNHGNNGGGSSVGCSPFNGPGGSANPFFMIKLNGSGVPAYLQNQATNCQNGCTSTLVVDPLAYQTAPAASATMGQSLSTAFQMDSTNTVALPAYYQYWAWTTNASGATVYGTFNSPINSVVNRKAVLTGYGWVQCGTTGASC